MNQTLNRITYLLSLIILIGCNNEPQVELKHDKAIIRAVIQDLYLTESALKDIEEDQVDSLKALYLSQIERIHQIKLSEVEEDISELQKHPKLYQQLHAEVRDSITMLEKRELGPSKVAGTTSQ